MGSDWPQIEARGPSITDSELSAFEESIGARLPDEYRRFLLATNGGRTADDHVRFRVADGEGNLNELYALSDIARSRKVLGDRLPEDLIPIGYDGVGDKICLAVRGDHSGEVWFFDTMNERPESANPRVEWSKRRDMTKLASSFGEFMASLSSLE